MVDEQANGFAINLNTVWANQGVSHALAAQLEDVAKAVSKAIFATPAENMNIGEWCKKVECWNAVHELEIPLLIELNSELISKEELDRIHRNAAGQARADAVIDAIVEVVSLRQVNYWNKLLEWSKIYHPLYGTELDLVRLACRAEWVPTDRQATKLIKVQQKLEQEGFR